MNESEFMEAAGFRGNFMGNHYVYRRDAESPWIPDYTRQIGKFYSPKWAARLLRNGGPVNPIWESELFDDPVTAFVSAQAANWGQ